MKKNLIEKFYYHKKLYAYVIHGNDFEEKVSFFSADEDFLQVGMHNRLKNENIKAHYHQFSKTEVDSLEEVVLVLSGKLKVSFFDDSGKKINSKILLAGDILVQLSLGHAFEFLEDSRLFEVKQGPFFKLKQKKHLDGN
jgi:CRP-like cAMP-binding protein